MPKKDDEINPEADSEDLYVERIRLENMDLRLWIAIFICCYFGRQYLFMNNLLYIWTIVASQAAWRMVSMLSSLNFEEVLKIYKFHAVNFFSFMFKFGFTNIYVFVSS